MPESFIVTIKYGAFEVDLDIPSELPASSWKGKLLEILKAFDARAFGGWGALSLSYNGASVHSSASLASLGAYDGSIIEVGRQ